MTDEIKPDYKAMWDELNATVLRDAWKPRMIWYESTSMLEWMAQLVEKHGGWTTTTTMHRTEFAHRLEDETCLFWRQR